MGQCAPFSHVISSTLASVASSREAEHDATHRRRRVIRRVGCASGGLACQRCHRNLSQSPLRSSTHAPTTPPHSLPATRLQRLPAARRTLLHPTPDRVAFSCPDTRHVSNAGMKTPTNTTRAASSREQRPSRSRHGAHLATSIITLSM
ncbi:hypothetical protein DFH09DRAFT_1339798 [Mycena vulgaris]|nr:hypothetical protein DFH09DRAFT_1339798 [Mycena vulgaris]